MATLEATVVTGLGEAEGFTALPWVTSQLTEKLGYVPHPGTLNLKLKGKDVTDWEEIGETARAIPIVPPEGFCSSACYPVKVGGRILAHVLKPHVPDYPADKLELVGPHNFRRLLGLGDGDVISLEAKPDKDVETFTPGPFDTLLFDLEGTLVDFQWKLAEAEAALREALQELGMPTKSLQGLDYATLRSHAYREIGMEISSRKKVDALLSPIYDRYDLDALSRWSLRDGAVELLEELAYKDIPCGLVSNIGRVSVLGFLEKFNLADRFAYLVTRNEVVFMKPDGEGILRALAGLERGPDNALMVGDSLSDLMAARDAEVPVALITGGESLQRPFDPWRPDYLTLSFEELSNLVLWNRSI